MGTTRGKVRTHSRKTASGGSTTVHQHSRRYTYAEQAAQALRDGGPKSGRRVAKGLALAGAGSIVWATFYALGAGVEGLVIASVAVVLVLMADNWKQARRNLKKGPKYMGPRARMHHFRVSASRRRKAHLDKHPFQKAAYDHLLTRYEVTGKGPAPTVKGQATATTTKVVRGRRNARKLETRGKTAGWSTTTTEV
jgi:hypothetical protein